MGIKERVGLILIGTMALLLVMIILSFLAMMMLIANVMDKDRLELSKN